MISPETLKKIEIFIKRQSNNNIIKIEKISYQACVGTPIRLNNSFSSHITPKIEHKLILDCRCKDDCYFEGYKEMGEMVKIMFNNDLTCISNVLIRYNYSTYCCKD